MGKESEQKSKTLYSDLSDWLKTMKKQKTEMEVRILSSEEKKCEYYNEDTRIDNRS